MLIPLSNQCTGSKPL